MRFLILILAFSRPALSLDTVEPLNPGLSNVEFYFGRSTDSHAFYQAIGYGVSPLLNPKIIPHVTNEGSGYEFGVDLQNSMTVYEGPVEVDLIPGVTSAKELTLGIELSRPTRYLTPYFQVTGLRSLEDSSNDVLVALGTFIPIEKAQLFLEISERYASGSIPTQRYGVGVNYTFSDNFELISEMTHELTWGGMIGFISTI